MIEQVLPKLTDGNKNTRNAALTLLLNISVFLIDKKDTENKIFILTQLLPALEFETLCANYQRLATLVGNLVVDDAQSLEMAQSMEVKIKDPKTLAESEPAAVKIIEDIKSDFGF